MANANAEKDEVSISEGRGPAYPSISLEKAIGRVEQLKTAGAVKIPLPVAGFLKIWDYKSESGPARRTIAALKHYGLLDYIGTGKDRKVTLTDMARNIVLDKVPDSVARKSAIKEAAMKPPIFAKLLEHFPMGIGTDAGLETFLTLQCGFSEDSAQNVIGIFKDTLRYAGLDKADNMPSEDEVKEVETMRTASDSITNQQVIPSVILNQSMPLATGENDMKVLLDGDRIRISAVVDLKGAKRLVRAIQANMALLSDEEED